MVIMSGTATVLQQFVSGLKSRNEDTRAKSAKDLQHYVTTELREVTQPGRRRCPSYLRYLYWFLWVISCLHQLRNGYKNTLLFACTVQACMGRKVGPVQWVIYFVATNFFLFFDSYVLICFICKY